MQLSRGNALVPFLTAVVVCLVSGWLRADIAHADNALHLRSTYYKEKATRVVQPMIDLTVDATPTLEIQGHLLLDAITSASVAAGTDDEAFTENRFEVGAGADLTLGRARVGGFTRFSQEPDYRSLFGGARATLELLQRNTTLGVVVGAGTDHVTNEGARFGLMPEILEGDLDTVLGSVSVTQLLSRQLVAGVTYDVSRLSGFLENAYRPVFGGGMSLAHERMPDTRVRHAIAGSVRAFLPMSRTTIIGSYRFYTDDWDLVAHTPELRVVQQIVPDLDVHVRYRYHRQGAAFFYEDIYDTLDEAVEPYVTEDIKLSAFDSHTVGGKIESALSNLGLVGDFGAWRVDVLFHYVIQNNRYGNAVVVQTGLSIPFGI